MNKSTLLSGLAGAVVLYILNFLFYGLSGFMEAYATEAGKAASKGEDMNMMLLVLGHLVIGYLMATLYHKWARGHHSAGHGGQFGGLVGILLGFGLGFIWMATSSFMTMTGFIADGIWQIVSYTITGVVIALVSGKLSD